MAFSASTLPETSGTISSLRSDIGTSGALTSSDQTLVTSEIGRLFVRAVRMLLWVLAFVILVGGGWLAWKAPTVSQGQLFYQVQLFVVAVLGIVLALGITVTAAIMTAQQQE